MARDLYILGTAGLAKEIAHLARCIDPHAQRWATIAYVAGSEAEIGQHLHHGSVRCTDAQLLQLGEDADVAIGIGRPPIRQKLAAQLSANPHLSFPNLVHPGVMLDEASVRLGRGNLICQGAALTCDIVLGDFNLLNLNVTVGHDTRLGDCNVVNPGTNISGNVHIGDACLLGTGSQVLERLRIASAVTVGAGAVVTRSLDEAGVYVGAPARRRP